MTVGYALVSTLDQDLSSQLDALKAAGAKTIYREKVSGTRQSLRQGDVVIITKIDRLARSTRELLNLIAAIDEAGASIKSLGDPSRMPRSPLIEHSLRPQFLDENCPLRTEKKADWLDGEDHA